MVKDILKSKYFYFISICILFVTAQIAFASNTFQNSLLKLEFYKTSPDAIKVVLYTSKPCADAINVNKKSDFEYIILLPETSNSMTAAPILNPVTGLVKAVNIRTQQYENDLKGYTKVTIATLKPVTIVSQTKTLSVADYNLNENDYKELLSQAVKRKPAIKKGINHPVVVKKRTTRIVKIQKPTSVIKPKVAKKTYNPTVSQVIKKENVSTKVKSTLISKPIAKKAIPEKPIVVKQKRVSPQTTITAPVTQKKVLKPEAMHKNLPQQQVSTAMLTPTTLQTQKPIQAPVAQEPPAKVAEKVVPVVKQESKSEKIKHFIKHNLYIIAGLIAAGFILLLLILRNIGQNIQKPKEIYTNINMDEAPTSVQDKENADEDISWQDDNTENIEPSQGPEAEFSEEILSETETFNEQETDVYASVTNHELDELFPNGTQTKTDSDDTVSQEYINQDDLIVNTEEIKTEPEADEEIKSQIQAEPEVEPEFEDKQEFEPEPEQTPEQEPSFEQETISEPQPESEPEPEPESESEFAPELETFPEEAENIEKELETAEQYQSFENGFIQENEVPRNEISFEEEEFDFDKLSEIFGEEEEISIVEEENISLPEIFPAVEAETISSSVESQDEIIKSEFILDDERGFYLVDFEDSTALVGHIGDEIFILKRFNEKIGGPLQARLNEKNAVSANYMVKTGNFKALIEVTNDNMNLLIEL